MKKSMKMLLSTAMWLTIIGGGGYRLLTLLYKRMCDA